MTDEKIVPPMHDAYYKARRLFVLFSLLLLINEWVGILDIRITEVISKVSFMGIEISVKSLKLNSETLAGAVFLGYLILWGYSFARYYIEWSQVDSSRREGKASKRDFRLTISTAFFAFSVWLIQRILRVQLAKEPLEFLLPFFVGLIVPLIFNFQKRSRLDEFDEKQKNRYYIIFIALSIIAPVLTLVYVLFIKKISFITILSLFGGLIIGMWENAVEGMHPFSPTATPTPGDTPEPSAPSAPSVSSDTTQTTEENNKSET